MARMTDQYVSRRSKSPMILKKGIDRNEAGMM